jgi:glycyl-tRNA synthetase (class II)
MTVDIEYLYPFTAPDFGELEGIAHRGCFDLTQHQTHSGKTRLLRPGSSAQAERAGAQSRRDQGEEPLHPQRHRAGIG